MSIQELSALAGTAERDRVALGGRWPLPALLAGRVGDHPRVQQRLHGPGLCVLDEHTSFHLALLRTT